MNKDWDKAVVSVEIWKECLRVLKAGSFAFIMSSPRQDVLCKMILNLIDAGFETNFTSMYHSYASGFPKAANVSKLVDKRNGRSPNSDFRDYLNTKKHERNISITNINRHLGLSTKGGNVAFDILSTKDQKRHLLPTLEQYQKLKTLLDLDNRFDELIEREEAEREIIGKGNAGLGKNNKPAHEGGFKEDYFITKSATEAAKRLDGSYAGFQPKPAVEVILVVMKPLSEKSFVDQSLKNGKGITWLDNVRIPFQNEDDRTDSVNKASKDLEIWKQNENNGNTYQLNRDTIPERGNEKGRFPANLIVSGDSLNDGKISKKSNQSITNTPNNKAWRVKEDRNDIWNGSDTKVIRSYGDSGSYSRYFDLDSWYRAQFIITPKASASERNKGLESLPLKEVSYNNNKWGELGILSTKYKNQNNNPRQNIHPTVKPLKLMSYLITMGSRPNDLILDPFCGSGTTCIAAYQLNRKFIGIELQKEYVEIANKRLEPYKVQNKITQF